MNKKSIKLIMIIIIFAMFFVPQRVFANIQNENSNNPFLILNDDKIKVTVEGVEDFTKAECDELIGENTITGKMINDAYNVIKFAVPIILLGMSIMDFGRAIVNQSQDEIKKASNRFITRLVISILIFVVPTILNFILRDLIGIKTCYL